MAWTYGSATMIALGVTVASEGLLYLGCGPTPGGNCGIGSNQVISSYLLGSLGMATVSAGIARSQIAPTDTHPHAPLSILSLAGAAGTSLLGGLVMFSGLLFTCFQSLLPDLAGCGVGADEGLIAYSFAMAGSAFLTWGLLGMVVWRKGPPTIQATQ